MCGIYGEYFNNSTLSSSEDFKQRNRLNTKRGPDAEGYWSNDRDCQFGFSRLSLVDLSPAGNQPMRTALGKYVMIYNGEIYNHQLLRSELIDQGITEYAGSSDSETLLNCFEQWGIAETLRKVDGMFAIGLYDTTNSQLHLIRDFAGIKPLFYGIKQGDVVFGSRYDQVTKHELFRKTGVDQSVLKLYLQLQYMPSPYGILEDTYQVDPGQWVVFSPDGSKTAQTFWSFPEPSSKDLIESMDEALDKVGTKLEQVVQQQLVADVPVGTFLSGGIDSPIITKFASDHHQHLEAFTIGSDSLIHDETEEAKDYAQQIGCSLFQRKMTVADALKLLEREDLFDEPFADPSLFPTALVSELARERVTGILSGDGGDELFFGYERFHSVGKNRKWRFIPKPLRYLCYGIDKVLTRNKYINGGLLAPTFGLAHKGLHTRTKPGTLDAIFPSLAQVHAAPMEIYNYDSGPSELWFYNKMRQAEFYGMMQKTLRKVDKMSMASSLEVRVPFLSKEFIELSSGVHPELSMNSGGKKRVLRNLLASLLPNYKDDERKRGFSVPLGDWLRSDLKAHFEQHLFEPDFIEQFGINSSRLQGIWDAHQDKEKDHKWLILTIYALERWWTSLK